MNKLTVVITETGWTETLEIVGKEPIVKRFEKTKYCSAGLDSCWEDELVYDELLEALENQRFDEVMDALSTFEMDDDE